MLPSELEQRHICRVGEPNEYYVRPRRGRSTRCFGTTMEWVH